LPSYIAEERLRSHDYGGRSVFGWEPPAPQHGWGESVVMHQVGLPRSTE
jgi:hypothetical protein